MTNTAVADTIYQQLGGRKFAVMTGAKFSPINDGIAILIGRNASKANRIEITLNGLDLYDVKFIKHTQFNVKIKNDGTVKVTNESKKVLAEHNDVYGDMLQDLFTSVTGLYTHL